MEGICDIGPTVYSPCPRRLESLIICGCNCKGSIFSPRLINTLRDSPAGWTWKPDDRPPSHLKFYFNSLTIIITLYSLEFYLSPFVENEMFDNKQKECHTFATDESISDRRSSLPGKVIKTRQNNRDYDTVSFLIIRTQYLKRLRKLIKASRYLQNWSISEQLWKKKYKIKETRHICCVTFDEGNTCLKRF